MHDVALVQLTLKSDPPVLEVVALIAVRGVQLHAPSENVAEL
jgi:hypothetical protein